MIFSLARYKVLWQVKLCACVSVSVEWQSEANIMGGGGGHSNVETLADVCQRVYFSFLQNLLNSITSSDLYIGGKETARKDQ